MRFPFFLTTLEGIEDILIAELKRTFRIHGVVVDRGIVGCTASADTVFLLNYKLKSCLRIVICLHQGVFDDLSDLYEQVKQVPWHEYIGSRQSFAIDCDRKGGHADTSLDMARSAGQAVVDRFKQAKKKAAKVDLENPAVRVFLQVIDDRFYIGLDTTGETLNRRGYKEYIHRAGLNPLLGYALLEISGWRKNKSLHDPFCGAGTILIEAYRRALQIPNLEREKTFACWKLRLCDRKLFKEQVRQVKEELSITYKRYGIGQGRRENDVGRNPRKKGIRLCGSDISVRHVEGARLNMQASGVPATVECADAVKVRYKSDFIVTNPPFGMRLGSKAKVHRTLRRFKRNVLRDKAVWENVTFLTLTPQLFRGFRFRKSVVYGPVQAFIMRYR